jgi:hypothetical protein
MTTPTTSATRGRAGRFGAAVAAGAVGVLIGVGATVLVVDDPTSTSAADVAANRPVGGAPAIAHDADPGGAPGRADQVGREQQAAERRRAAVTRCVLGPDTSDAAAACLAGLRHP